MTQTTELSPVAQQAVDMSVRVARHIVDDSIALSSSHPLAGDSKTVQMLFNAHVRIATEVFLALKQADHAAG